MNPILTKSFIKEASLIALAMFSLSLLLFRMVVTESIFYGFLAWNLILAGVPYLVSWYLGENPQLAARKKWLVLFSAIWLLFLPNAPYLITDFLHFKRESDMPEWFDVLLLMSFAWSGIALAFVSMQDMQRHWHCRFGPMVSWILLLAFSLLSGFGIYLGRYLRYNSWDIISDPIALLLDIPPLLFELRSIGFSLGYGAFVFLSYSFFKINSVPNL